ncbi:hypothetical protein PDIG_78590 [Penicillium digitatum PHI26]|uniref:Uncharacterized protein n=2 Tax=Penicillium digitatum TaxID=36651 RepID=K9FYG4_PEND2|nr:hypothetical protein PDIP_27000 [Penicillium digitatum Pd1]EKV06081.1 hypothetical protein PDIG_78590 [Penicillium digitatum PHI26]EKV18433.1 hypothetical protein PDIP_27000 [Penicillium digitatum Pd1]
MIILQRDSSVEGKWLTKDVSSLSTELEIPS